ncbi:hypothetical protein Pelo_11554 [Pelomyxa schiedti]|nr:hypothetical protein Pelo_11554 [Pelomyxa schiedti]
MRAIAKVVGREKVKLQQSIGSLEKTVDPAFDSTKLAFESLLPPLRALCDPLSRLTCIQMKPLFGSLESVVVWTRAQSVVAHGTPTPPDSAPISKTLSVSTGCIPALKSATENFKANQDRLALQVSSFYQSVTSIKKSIALRETERINYDKWQQKLASESVEHSELTERKLEQHKSTYEFMNDQIKKEIIHTYDEIDEALREVYERTMTSFAGMSSTMNAIYGTIRETYSPKPPPTPSD